MDFNWKGHEFDYGRVVFAKDIPAGRSMEFVGSGSNNDTIWKPINYTWGWLGTKGAWQCDLIFTPERQYAVETFANNWHVTPELSEWELKTHKFVDSISIEDNVCRWVWEPRLEVGKFNKHHAFQDFYSHTALESSDMICFMLQGKNWILESIVDPILVDRGYVIRDSGIVEVTEPTEIALEGMFTVWAYTGTK